MKRNGFLVAALATLLALPAVTKAAVENPWELTLGGGASNSNDFDGFTGNINGQIGYYFSETFELALRQTIQYTDIGGAQGEGSAWNGSTRVAFDIHFPLGDTRDRFPLVVPFVGANIGYIYGQSVNDTWAAAPEVGVKLYLDERTFLFVLAEYQFFFEDADNADDAFDDGAFVYTIGLGFRF
jgi:hypothetical protein